MEIMEMRYKILRSQDYQDSIGEMSVRNPCTPEFHLFQCFHFFQDALLLSTLPDASGPSKFIHPQNATASAGLSGCASDFSSGRACKSQRCRTIFPITCISPTLRDVISTVFGLSPDFQDSAKGMLTRPRLLEFHQGSCLPTYFFSC